MKKILPHFKLILCFLIIGFHGSLFAAANFNNLTVTASPNTVIIGQTTNVNLNWTITVSSDSNVTGNIVATSTEGVFANNLGTNFTTLTHDFGQTNDLINFPHVFFEPVTISSTLSNQANTLGFTSLQYQRTFTLMEGSIPSGTIQATATLNLVAPATNPAAALTLTRIALRFSDNSIVKVIKQKTAVSALAELSYTGTGLLDAIWEVAEPVSTVGTPIYTPLMSVRQYLGAGGRIYLQSPPLPSDKQGLHIVRLRVRQPSNLSFTQPVLQYSVSSEVEPAGTIRPLPSIAIQLPPDNALLEKDTRFQWQAVKGARAYQLELYPIERSGIKLDETAIAKRAPATGMMVPGKRTSLQMGELSRQQLRPGETYGWRIIAIGKDGQILSTSALQEIRIP